MIDILVQHRPLAVEIRFREPDAEFDSAIRRDIVGWGSAGEAIVVDSTGSLIAAEVWIDAETTR